MEHFTGVLTAEPIGQLLFLHTILKVGQKWLTVSRHVCGFPAFGISNDCTVFYFWDDSRQDLSSIMPRHGLIVNVELRLTDSDVFVAVIPRQFVRQMGEYVSS